MDDYQIINIKPFQKYMLLELENPNSSFTKRIKKSHKVLDQNEIDEKLKSISKEQLLLFKKMYFTLYEEQRIKYFCDVKKEIKFDKMYFFNVISWMKSNIFLQKLIVCFGTNSKKNEKQD